MAYLSGPRGLGPCCCSASLPCSHELVPGSRRRTQEIDEGLIRTRDPLYICNILILTLFSKNLKRSFSEESEQALRDGWPSRLDSRGDCVTFARSRPQTAPPHLSDLCCLLSCPSLEIIYHRTRDSNARTRRRPYYVSSSIDALARCDERKADDSPRQGSRRTAKRRGGHAGSESQECDRAGTHGWRRSLCRVSLRRSGNPSLRVLVVNTAFFFFF